MAFVKVPAWISVNILFLLCFKRLYIYICWTKFRLQQYHRVVLKLAMWLGSYNNRYCGYCMIETSLSNSFDIIFNVSRVYCDNYCEIWHTWVKLEKSPFYSLKGEKFLSCDCVVFSFRGHLQINESKIQIEKTKSLLVSPLNSFSWLKWLFSLFTFLEFLQ
jgi:hypothetical protein